MTLSRADSQSPRSRNYFKLFFLKLWGTFKVLFFVSLAMFIVVQLMTPSLRYNAKDHDDTYKTSTEPQWFDVTGLHGSVWKAFSTTITTQDSRELKVDYFAPQNIASGPTALTIIITGFTTPEWLLEKVRPRGFSTVVIYRSPRLKPIMRTYWPTFQQITSISDWKSFRETIATNPFNKMYNMHAMLHEAPSDIADIARWANTNIQTDLGRINLIGLGSGSLIAAAAAHKMEIMGIPARTISLVYPPANMAAGIRDNLLGWPNWVRKPLSHLLELVYFRLDLSQHLPYVGANTARLLVIPVNAFELANYAAEPTIGLSNGDTSIERLDVEYTGYYTDANTTRIRKIIGEWLIKQGAIPSY